MDWLDIKESLKDLIKYVILIIIVIVVVVYVVGLHQIVGSSMKPTLNDGDIVFLNKIGYKFSNIKRNDIISLYYEETKYLIKRVIGLPGEYIEYNDGFLYVNGEKKDENFLNSLETPNFKLTDLGYETIPEDMYLVIGDNRLDSFDSRDANLGLINKEDILGKINFRIWPLNKFGVID